MPFTHVRLRPALFFVATPVPVQLLKSGLVQELNRQAMVAEGERQLTASAAAFVAQMDDISARVASNVEVLSLDYALRSAIVEPNNETMRSVLPNHGRLVAASRMLLITPDGRVEVNTDEAGTPMTTFSFPDLIDRAYDQRTAAIATISGRASWMTVVPISAPRPVGLVVVNVPVDDALLAHLQTLSALPQNVELAAEPVPRHWMQPASGSRHAGLLDSLPAAHHRLRWKPLRTRVHGGSTWHWLSV